MRRLAFGLISASALLVSVQGCNIEDKAPEKTKSSTNEIVGGTQDNVNQATAYIYSESDGYACSGTVISVNGDIGYVLTAGHCVSGTITGVCIGADLNTADCHQAVQQWQHPSYDMNQLVYDFGMVAFNGATGATVVPAAQSPDGLSNSGSQIELSGYGIVDGSPQTETDHRMHVTVTTSANASPINTSIQIGYSQEGGQNGIGACEGDSGGPAYFNGTVVGVTSYGDQNCEQFGVSGRVSAVYDSWIVPILNGAPPTQTCDECQSAAQGGQCKSVVDACIADAACSALANCIADCQTDACVQTCANQHPTGIDGYNAIFFCLNCDACSTICDQSQCNETTSSTTSSSVSSGTTNPSSTTTAAGGNAGGGDDGSGGDGDGRKQPVTVTTCSACAVGASSDVDAAASLGALGMLGIALFSRRRRSA